MFSLNAIHPAVSVDRRAGRPTEFRVGRDRIAVTSLESVRDETSAYPVESGPRTVFVVSAQGRRYRLVHQLRGGRWTVEELAAPSRTLASAA